MNQFFLIFSYKIVIHGCIDGFSRKIIYLNCRDNNRAATVFTLFQRGVERHGLPSRMRGDKGSENMDVAKFFLEHPDRAQWAGAWK